MFPRAFCCWAACSLAALAAAQAPAWTWSGPAQLLQVSTGVSLAGTVDALAWASSSTGSPVLLAAGLGGVWRFNPAAQTWLAGSLAAPVASLLVAPDGTIFAGTGDVNPSSIPGSGLMRSSDGGATWSLLGAAQLSGLSITALALDPAHPEHLLAAAISAAASPASARPGIYASTDSGDSWSLLLPGEFSALAWQGSAVLAVGTAAAALSSSDAAPGSFVSVSGLPSAWACAALAPANASGFLLLLANPQSGASLWSVSASGVASAQASLPQLNGSSTLAIAVNPAGDILAAGDGVWRRSGSGQSWQEISPAPAGSNAIITDAGNNFWIAANHGVWRLPAGAAALASINTGLANTAPLALLLGAQSSLAILAGGGIASGPLSAAATWTVFAPSIPLTAIAPDPAQPGALFAIAQGQLLHSADDGVSWQLAPLPQGFSATPISLASSSQGLWIGASDGSLLAPTGARSVFPAPPNQIVLAPSAIWVASGSDLYTSADLGQTWSLATTAPATITGLAVDALQPQIVAAACSAGLFWSLNGGSSWTSPQTLPVAVPIAALQFDSRQTLWAATLGRGLWSASFLNQGAALSILNPPVSVAAGAPISLQVQLLQSGSPVAGAALQFSASEHGSSIWSSPATTDAEGVAAVTFSTSLAGSIAVQVTPPPAVPAVPLQISFPVVAGAPAQLRLLSGANQAQLLATTLAAPVVIQVYDAFGNPVAGAAVALTRGSASVSSAITGSNGQTAFTLQLPPLPGPVAYTASVTGAPALSWQEEAFTNSDFQLSLTLPSSATSPGQPQTLLLQVIPSNGFNHPVSLSCVQPVINCQISPPVISPGETAAVTVKAFVNQPSVNVEIAGMDSVSSAPSPQSATIALPLQAFSLSATAAALTVHSGSTTAPVALNLTAFNGLTGPLQFQLSLADGSALPVGLVPSFQPATAALAAQPVQVEFSLTAPAQAVAAPTWDFFLFISALFLIAFRRRRLASTRARPWRSIWAIACISFATLACGGAPSSAPPPQTPASPSVVYILQLTASSQGLSASVPFQVTLTP